MKKLISFILTAVIFCSSFAGMSMAEAAGFIDVPENAWYYKDVNRAVELGLIGGKGNNRYAPNENLTYAEAIKLAACMNKKSVFGNTEFERDEVWYRPYVTYAEQNGIKLREYNLNANITRSDFLDLFSRALPADKMKEINSIVDGAIPDVSMDYPNAKSIYKMYRVGAVAGSDNAHNCRPGTNILRSEVATILVRMMDETARIKFSINLSDVRIRYNTGYGVYDAKLDEYYKAISMSRSELEATHDDASSVNIAMIPIARDGGQIEYALSDIDGNGIKELVFLMGENIIDLYTAKDGALVKLFRNCTFGQRIYLEILKKGEMLVTAQNGDYAEECILYRINEAGDGLTRIYAAYHDETGEDVAKTRYEHLTYDQYTSKVQTYQENSIINSFVRCTLVDSVTISQEQHYENGTKHLEKGDYLKAADEFARALDYKDAPKLQTECFYQEAKYHVEGFAERYGKDIGTLRTKYDLALKYLGKCEGYKDTDILKKQLKICYDAKIRFTMNEPKRYGNFNRAKLEIEGDIVKITAESFTMFDDRETRLEVTYDARNSVFNATWSGEEHGNLRGGLYDDIWGGIVSAFTGITDTSELVYSYKDEEYWSQGSTGVGTCTIVCYGYEIKTSISGKHKGVSLNIETKKTTRR